MIDRIDLLTLIKDWHVRETHPLISITRSAYSDVAVRGHTMALGHVWIGDFDVANIFDRQVVFAGWKNADGPDAPYHVLDAADPEFFIKLDKMFTFLAEVLKE